MRFFTREKPVIATPVDFLKSRGFTLDDIEYVLTKSTMEIDMHTWGRIMYALNMHRANELAEKQAGEKK